MTRAILGYGAALLLLGCARHPAPPVLVMAPRAVRLHDVFEYPLPRGCAYRARLDGWLMSQPVPGTYAPELTVHTQVACPNGVTTPQTQEVQGHLLAPVQVEAVVSSAGQVSSDLAGDHCTYVPTYKFAGAQ